MVRVVKRKGAQSALGGETARYVQIPTAICQDHVSAFFCVEARSNYFAVLLRKWILWRNRGILRGRM